MAASDRDDCPPSASVAEYRTCLSSSLNVAIRRLMAASDRDDCLSASAADQPGKTRLLES